MFYLLHENLSDIWNFVAINIRPPKSTTMQRYITAVLHGSQLNHANDSCGIAQQEVSSTRCPLSVRLSEGCLPGPCCFALESIAFVLHFHCIKLKAIECYILTLVCSVNGVWLAVNLQLLHLKKDCKCCLLNTIVTLQYFEKCKNEGQVKVKPNFFWMFSSPQSCDLSQVMSVESPTSDK